MLLFFISLFHPFLHLGFSFIDQAFRRSTALPNSSVLVGALTDLPRTKAELLIENALLRHQLAILQFIARPSRGATASGSWL